MTPKIASLAPRRLARPLLFTCAVTLVVACNLSTTKNKGDADNTGSQTQAQQANVVLPPGVNTNPSEPSQASAAVSAGIVGGPNNSYTLVGRFDTSLPDRITFAFANSKVGARFVGTNLSVKLATTGNDTYDVQIDDRPSVVLSPPATAASSPNTYPIASDLTAGVAHTVWLTKRTEAYATANGGSEDHTGACTFYGFDFGANGSFLKSGTDNTTILTPGTRPRLIEVIGDSALTGYGVLNYTPPGAISNCNFNPNMENALQSIPKYLGDAMDAEVLNISSAGKGIYKSVYNKDLNSQMPTVWQKTIWPNSSPVWSFTDPTIQAVILQAGSNDLDGEFNEGFFPDRPAFVSTYANFLAAIRQKRPHAAIVSVITQGADANDKATLRAAFTDAMNQRIAAGDTGLYIYDYFQNDPNGWVWYQNASQALQLGSGCEGHPSDKGAAFLAGRLATYLKTLPNFQAQP